MAPVAVVDIVQTHQGELMCTVSFINIYESMKCPAHSSSFKSQDHRSVRFNCNFGDCSNVSAEIAEFVVLNDLDK